MAKSVLFIGLDVDDNAYNGCAITRKGEEIFFQTHSSSIKLIKRLEQFVEKGFKPKICYEATYLGFSLLRDLQAAGFDCIVIAPNLIPQIPGKRVKTDKIDARNMAKLYQKEEDEADRGLLRSRGFVQDKIRDFKCHIKMLCRKYGWHYRQDTLKNEYWTGLHRGWLEKKIEESKIPTLKETMKVLLGMINQLEENLDFLDKKIEELARSPKYKTRHEALICYRGIKTNTAMTLITEIGDIKRFPHPKKLVSYFGMDIAEYSSGGKECKFGMTKQGNAYGRYSIIEANHNAPKTARTSNYIKRRREGVRPEYLEIADRCTMRLYWKSKKMINREKNYHIVKTACAREMLCFVWESLKLADKQKSLSA
jgi:transposase